MPIYNGEKFLEKSIKSVAEQTLKDIELLCIDDGSTDNSLELLYNLSNEYNFIKILTQENKGSGIARNIGINDAKGEYIAFLDADDEFLDNDALERMYSVSKINNADIISANLQMINNDNEIVNNFFYSNKDYLFISKNDVIAPETYGLPLSFYKNLFRREFLLNNDIAFPDLKRGQDPPFLAKAITSTSEIPVVPVNLYGHHFQSGGGAENKVDSYAKKYDYLTHYKLTFDILEEKGYFDLLDRYKQKLFIYLNNNFNEDNELIGFKLVDDIFDNKYFEGYENQINKFRINQIINHLNCTSDANFFINAKHLISEYNVQYNKLLSTSTLKRCFLILSLYSLEQYKKEQLNINDNCSESTITKNYSNNYSNNLTKYFTARIDIKNFGNDSNKIEIVENSDSELFITQPKWFKDKLGIGTQIESKKSSLYFKIKCINEGNLKINLRGIDFRDMNKNRVPIYVQYDEFIVNDNRIIQKPILVWHDDPYTFEKKVKDGEIVTISIKWEAM